MLLLPLVSPAAKLRVPLELSHCFAVASCTYQVALFFGDKRSTNVSALISPLDLAFGQALGPPAQAGPIQMVVAKLFGQPEET